jgi:hypothetical protein
MHTLHFIIVLVSAEEHICLSPEQLEQSLELLRQGLIQDIRYGLFSFSLLFLTFNIK